ncbi:hypothetical protein [Lactiplantibacillus plantarum]|uniref:hypothetical protein n=1 Tax=Lactiplantibacillus plantarum TaxID=1590 RepID=UPI00070BAE19|nr:hypothetical protein [Lactiplantibacillus plantarum]AYC70874.1 hypothetical protein D5289_02060 [Lactiplantibacillus plantarum]MCT3251159.1 hypothetical protein [Lactiplantibacillus plantarum]QDJ20222.1 hypothetical protein LLY606_08700 [Lactiplantibacillus plantarum]RDG03333.1 hypothetical protein DQM19_03515 [Lactiplantibacillus plantarum]GJI52855.1 hypothetical protein NMZ1139_10830 [Lactiplantibacillus plantarum]
MDLTIKGTSEEIKRVFQAWQKQGTQIKSVLLIAWIVKPTIMAFVTFYNIHNDSIWVNFVVSLVHRGQHE